MTQGFVTTSDGCRIAWHEEGDTSAPALMAWLAGSVHGVVVQITAKASPLISGSPKALASAAVF